MHVKKHLNFDALRQTIQMQALRVPDSKQDGKLAYGIHDCVLSAFAMMSLQDPSVKLACHMRVYPLLRSKSCMKSVSARTVCKDVAL